MFLLRTSPERATSRKGLAVAVELEALERLAMPPRSNLFFLSSLLIAQLRSDNMMANLVLRMMRSM